MGESLNIFKPFPISFIHDHPARDSSGAGGLDGHARDILEGGMDNADRTVSHSLFHVYTLSNCLVESAIRRGHDGNNTFPAKSVQMLLCFTGLHGEAGGNAPKGAWPPFQQGNNVGS